MTVAINRQWLLKQRPVGAFKDSDFEYHEAPMPTISKGQALVKTLYLSFDPTQRIWAAVDSYIPAIPLGMPMQALTISQVIESKSKKYKAGDIVSGLMTWQEYAVISEKDNSVLPPIVMPGFLDLQLTLALLLTGLTAYFGLLEVGKPRPGDTVLVSGAAGATGSMVVQIAKLKGARVVGIAGGPDKCLWLKEVAKVDEVIDYKNEDLRVRVAETCPNGIDVFFDNVGGETLDAALINLAHGARVVICGAISQYNNISSNINDRENDSYGVKATVMLISSSARMQGFLISDFKNQFNEGLMLLTKWVEEGKIVQQIDCQQGFENIPSTLQRLFLGENKGKQILKLSDPALPLNTNPLMRLAFGLMKAFVSWRKG